MYKTKIDNLDLKQIADSGQCFRWKNTGENEYTVVAFDRALRIKQDGNEFELDCDEADWNNIWKSYLDMDTDYAGIAKLIADGDDAHLKEAYAYGCIHFQSLLRYRMRYLMTGAWALAIGHRI